MLCCAVSPLTLDCCPLCGGRGKGSGRVGFSFFLEARCLRSGTLAAGWAALGGGQEEVGRTLSITPFPD